MAPTEAEVNDTVRELRHTPKLFKAVAGGLTDGQLRRPPEPGAWSVHELLAHLRGCADVNGDWIARMLAEDRPTIRYVSARTGMAKTGYEQHDFVTFRRAFERQRADLVKTLAALDLPAWNRGATFTGTTPGATKTVYDVARGLVMHERAHADQVKSAAAAAAAALR